MDQHIGPDSAVAPMPASRRDILRIATGTAGVVGVLGVVGVAAVIVPRLNSVATDATSVVPVDAIDVDLAPLQPGQQILVFWRNWPVSIARRTPAALARLADPALVEQLLDPHSQERQQPPYAGNPQRSIKAEYSVLIGICTHMGCQPQFYPEPSPREPEADWLGGYYCPCHGSKYDLAGRVYKGVPAPYNLPVPPHRFVDDRTLRIGENPPNVKFDFGSIVQI